MNFELTSELLLACDYNAVEYLILNTEYRHIINGMQMGGSSHSGGGKVNCR